MIPCPDKHGTTGFSVIVRADENLGRYRFECVESVPGDLCGSERELVRLLGLTESEIRLDTASVDVDPTVTLAESIARKDETTSPPLIAATQGTLLPAAGTAILAAKTGDGKTTFVVELVLHAAAGRDYIGLSFSRPLRILIVENEGPREAFREKLEQRLAAWPSTNDDGPEPESVRIWDVPAEWGAVRLSNPDLRQQLRAVVEQHRIDLVVADTLTRFGVRGNGTPEETREFVELLNEVGMGRDVAFLLLHHPRSRTEPGEAGLERIAGAWPPHADVILLLQKIGNGWARLSFPKARWARGERPGSILAFDSETESFTYARDDEPEERDYVAELAALMVNSEWWTVTALRKKKDDGGMGADPEPIKQALSDDRFESVSGDEIGKRKDATYYLLRQASSGADDGHDASSSRREEMKRRPSSPKREALGDDASSLRDALDPDEIERLAQLSLEAQADAGHEPEETDW